MKIIKRFPCIFFIFIILSFNLISPIRLKAEQKFFFNIYGNKSQEFKAIKTDSKGNVFGLINCSDTTFLNNNSNFIAIPYYDQTLLFKIDSSGKLLWYKTFTHSRRPKEISIIYSLKLEIDKQDNIIITGGTYDYFIYNDKDTIKSPMTAFLWKPFVLKVDNDGKYLWSKLIDQEGDILNLSMDEEDNIYVSGRFGYMANIKDKIQVDKLLITKDYKFTYFLLKLDKNGNTVYLKPLVSTIEPLSYNIKFIANDTFIINGVLDKGNLIFNGNYLISDAKPLTFFIAKIGPEDKAVWCKTYTDFPYRYDVKMSKLPNGEIVLAGEFFKWGNDFNKDQSKHLIMLYSKNGEKLKEFSFDVRKERDNQSELTNIISDKSGNIFLIGKLRYIKIGNLIKYYHNYWYSFYVLKLDKNLNSKQIFLPGSTEKGHSNETIGISITKTGKIYCGVNYNSNIKIGNKLFSTESFRNLLLFEVPFTYLE